jgi:predicted nucleic acid-binding protein
VRDAITVVDTTRAVALEAGEVLAQLGPRARPVDLLAIDAILVVTAAARGCAVYTADRDDIVPLRDKLVDLGKLPNRAALPVHFV